MLVIQDLPPSNSGTWSFIGIPYKKENYPGVVCCWVRGRSKLYSFVCFMFPFIWKCLFCCCCCCLFLVIGVPIFLYKKYIDIELSRKYQIGCAYCNSILLPDNVRRSIGFIFASWNSQLGLFAVGHLQNLGPQISIESVGTVLKESHKLKRKCWDLCAIKQTEVGFHFFWQSKLIDQFDL